MAHVAAHELAIKAVRAAAVGGEGERAGRLKCRWQREQLPDAIRDLVLSDQRLRNAICWSVSASIHDEFHEHITEVVSHRRHSLTLHLASGTVPPGQPPRMAP